MVENHIPPAFVGGTTDLLSQADTLLRTIVTQLAETKLSSARHHHLKSAEHYARAMRRSIELAHNATIGD